MLVEDGALTDELYAVVEQYRTKYSDFLHIVVNEKNLGVRLALNVGLKTRKNELAVLMDTGDICKSSDRCEKQLKRFEEKSHLAIVGSHIEEFVGAPDNIIS